MHNDSEPFFSIVIPTFNREKFLLRSIQSIVNQKYDDWELIIIDDASTDKTQNVIKSFHLDQRIKSLRNDQNMERSFSRNKGIASAKGKYICFLDSDDEWLADHLMYLFLEIEKKGTPIGMFYTHVMKRQSNGNTEAINIPFDSNAPISSVIKFNIPIITVSVSHQILLKEKFSTDLFINEDVWLLARIAAQFPVFNVPYYTAVWNIHESNTKGLHTDHITPQISATKYMLRDGLLNKGEGRKYLKFRLASLYGELVFQCSKQGETLKSLSYTLKAFYNYVNFSMLKRNLGNIFYNSPFGKNVYKNRLKRSAEGS